MAKVKTLVKEDWFPNENTIQWFREEYSHLNLEEFVENFVDQCHANGYKYVNHDRALKAWARRQPKPPKAAGQKVYKIEPQTKVDRRKADKAISAMRGALGKRRATQ